MAPAAWATCTKKPRLPVEYRYDEGPSRHGGMGLLISYTVIKDILPGRYQTQVAVTTGASVTPRSAPDPAASPSPASIAKDRVK